MSTLTFDTYEAIQLLIDKGIDREQAEGITQVVRKAQEAHLDELATKGDLVTLKNELKLEMDQINHKIELFRKDIIITLGSLIIGIAGLMIAYLELRGGTPPLP